MKARQLSPMNHKAILSALIAVGLVASGCSNQAIVAGNIASMVVTFALFYTTINLRPDGGD